MIAAKIGGGPAMTPKLSFLDWAAAGPANHSVAAINAKPAANVLRTMAFLQGFLLLRLREIVRERGRAINRSRLPSLRCARRTLAPRRCGPPRKMASRDAYLTVTPTRTTAAPGFWLALPSKVNQNASWPRKPETGR